MNNTLLSELKSACQAQPSPSDSERIAHGVSTWFSGRATHAPDGTIALALSEEAKVIIAETNVRAVTKEGDVYRVEVSAESNFLLRLEKVMKATVNDGCGNKKNHPPRSLARDAGSGDDEGDIVLEIGPVTVCDLVCGDFVLAGVTFHVCVPVNCRTSHS